MSFAKIHKYIIKRYSLLSNVVSVIEEKKGNFVEKQRQREIMRSSNIVEQLQILLEENRIRIGDGEGYHYDIQTLIELFTAPQDFPEQEKEEVSKYLNSLNLLVEELYGAFQSMMFAEVDLEHSYLLHSSTRKYIEVSYDLSKVFEYLNNPYYTLSLVDHHLKRLISTGYYRLTLVGKQTSSTCSSCSWQD